MNLFKASRYVFIVLALSLACATTLAKATGTVLKSDSSKQVKITDSTLSWTQMFTVNFDVTFKWTDSTGSNFTETCPGFSPHDGIINYSCKLNLPSSGILNATITETSTAKTLCELQFSSASDLSSINLVSNSDPNACSFTSGESVPPNGTLKMTITDTSTTAE